MLILCVKDLTFTAMRLNVCSTTDFGIYFVLIVVSFRWSLREYAHGECT